MALPFHHNNCALTRARFLGVASAFAAAPLLAVDQSPQEMRFGALVVRADLDAIWTTLLDVGAEPFFTSDRATVEALYRRTRAQITSAMTLREAWLAVAPVLGALNDGHVGLGFPDPLNDAPYRFPLFFALSESNALTVVHDRTNTVPIGSSVVSIEGIPAQQYTDVALASNGGQTTALQRSRITTSGAWPAIALFGDRSSYRVRWITPSGVPGVADIVATLASSHAHSVSPYTYTTLRDGTIGYIDYRSCEDLPRFTSFLESTFAAIERSPIHALVIDVRKNGGGDSDLNDLLWTYVTTKPFRQFGAMIEKACDRLKREYGHDKYVEIYDEQAWNAPDGTIIREGTKPTDGLIYPKPLALRYNGPVYLLISSQTFSSAMSCALAAKDYGLATIVGEETGEPANTTGEVYTETTPGLGLRAWLTTKVFLAPKPHPNRQGVVPDVVVPTTEADIAAGRDPVLERVFQMTGDA